MEILNKNIKQDDKALIINEQPEDYMYKIPGVIGMENLSFKIIGKERYIP